MKTCNRCEEAKPDDEFYKATAAYKTKDGLRNPCKKCSRKDAKERYIANPRKKKSTASQRKSRREYARKWRLKNPGYYADWFKNHKETHA